MASSSLPNCFTKKVCPSFKGALYLGLEFVALVHRYNAPKAAGHVIEGTLDDVKVGSGSGHTRCCRSAQIMQAPWRNVLASQGPHLTVKPRLHLAEAGHGRVAVGGENNGCLARDDFDLSQNFLCEWGQHEDV